MANPATSVGKQPDAGKNWHVYLAVLAVASAVYLGCIVSPPSLMDDADAVQAQISRNLLSSGDWVTARLDGVVYLEKPPLIRAPDGTLNVDHHYYTFLSVFFYANRDALLLNGRFNNLEYGAYAPGAPPVFLDDSQFKDRGSGRSGLIWLLKRRYGRVWKSWLAISRST